MPLLRRHEPVLLVRTSISNYLEHLLGDHFRLERRLQGGPKSDVFVARDLRNNRQIVLKALRADRAMPVDVDRFRREMRLAAALRHPRIVPVLDVGDADGTLYYTMPFIDGESLRQRLRRMRTLSLGETVRVLRDVADALDHAHRRGVVHRDVKPENILLRDDHAYVTDLGIAKAIAAPLREPTLTLLGVALGTPGYMAPEQALGDPSLDYRADLYALGVIGYEMLVGSIPAMPSVVPGRGKSIAPSVTARRDDVPFALDVLIRGLLARDPRDRPSLDEVRSLLALVSPRALDEGSDTARRQAIAG